MQEFLKKHNCFIEKQTVNLLLFAAFVIPFYKPLIAPIFSLLVFVSLFQSKKTVFKDLTKYKGLCFLIVFYILHIIGLFYSENSKSASFDLEVKLSLFLIPVIFISIKDIIERNIDKFLLFFFLGTLFSCLVCLLISLFHSLYFESSGIIFNPDSYFIGDFYLGTVNNFYYTTLSYFIHPSYFSMYISFSIVIALFFLYYGKISKVWLKYLMFFSFPFFFLMIYLLSSRAGIISSFIVLVFCLYLMMRKRLNGFFKIVIVMISIVFVFIVLKNNNRLNTGIKQIIGTTYDSHSSSLKTQNVRLLIWNSSFEIIKNNYIIGVGTGDINDELLKGYEKNKVSDAFQLHLNAHNQFLQTILGLGIVGLFLLVLLLFVPFWRAIKNRDFLITLFILIVSVNFMFESMLNTQAGVVFFVFFYSLLVFKQTKTTETQI